MGESCGRQKASLRTGLGGDGGLICCWSADFMMWNPKICQGTSSIASIFSYIPGRRRETVSAGAQEAGRARTPDAEGTCIDAGVSMCRNDDPSRALDCGNDRRRIECPSRDPPRYPSVAHCHLSACEGRGAPQRRWILTSSLILLFTRFLTK